MTNDSISDAELHAYVDGRLDNTRRAAVERYLTLQPQAAECVAQYQQLNTALHALYDPVLTEPLSAPGLVSPRTAPRLAWAASVAIAILVGAALGWQFHGEAPMMPLPTTLVQQATMAHAVFVPEVRHPVEVTAAEETHLVQWLSKRLGADVHAPRLNEIGFELVGGRLLPADGGAAAQFMYQNPAGVRLTLYVRRDAVNETTAFRFAEQEKLRVFYWTDGPFGYALSGEIEKDMLLRVATTVHEQLQR
jgi:anti-sigma factor RsiW